MRRSNLWATIAKLLLVLVMLAALFAILYVYKSRESVRREELAQKREEYQTQIQSTLNENTFTVRDNPAENEDRKFVEATDVLNGANKGVILVDPEHYKRNVRLTNFNETLDGSAVAELQRFEEEVDEEDLLVLQFVAYTNKSTVDMDVTVGREVKNIKSYSRDEKIPGVSISQVHVTTTPTTFYIPMTGFTEDLTVLKLQTTSPWSTMTLDSVYLINYGKKQDPKQLKIGSYPEETDETRLTGLGMIAGDYSHCLLQGDVLYAAGAGTLTAFDPSGNVLSQLEGMGQSGEMVLTRDGKKLVLAAKQSGLYVIDIADPANMTILSHYDTVESAVGICLNGKYAFVSCGYSGVEVVDISQPETPRFVTNIRVEDAVHDCYVDGQTMYAGKADEKAVVVYDLSDITAPVELGLVELDGSCQAVYASDGILYAATGMDSRNDCENDWGFGVGGGNGVEIHDVTNLEEPVKLATIPLGGRYDLPGVDSWDLQVSNGYMYLTAMRFGMYVFDVTELSDPKLVSHHIYTERPVPDAASEGYLLNYDTTQETRADFVHTTVENGVLYVVVADKGIFQIESPGATPPKAAPEGSYQESEPEEAQLPRVTGYNVSLFDADAPVWAVDVVEGKTGKSNMDRIYAACGDAGVVVLDGDLEELSRYTTNGSVQDIKIWKGYAYLAKGAAGVEICAAMPNALREIATIELPPNQCATSIAVVGEGQYLVVQTGANSHVVVDTRVPRAPVLVEIDGVSIFRGTGRMTRRNVISGLINNRYVGIFGEKGIYLYGTTRTNLVQMLAENNSEILSSGSMAATATMGVASSEDGYICFSIGTSGISNARNVKSPGVGGLHGKLAFSRNLLVNSEGHTGKVSIFDISSVYDPLLIAEFTVDGTPDLAWVSQKYILIPCHNGGLLKLDNQRLTEVALWNN